MRIGIFQFAPRFGDKEANIARIEAAVRSEQADLAVMPELFSTGYGFSTRSQVVELAEEIPSGPTVARLSALARATGVAIVAGIAEKAGDDVYNSCFLVRPDGAIDTYRKIHLFGREKVLFDPGDIRPAVWQLNTVKIGAIVCFDYFFPELTRALALAGAQLVCHPANLVMPYAQAVTVARAMENRVFWAMCNRTGTEYVPNGRELTFTGMSQIVSPGGEVLYRSGREEEVFRVVEIDPSAADDKSVLGNNLFADRRPEMYSAGNQK